MRPAFQEIAAKPGERDIHATYRVTNRGGRKLILMNATTTCGCTVASISPKVLGSGQTGVVTLIGDPPGGGQKRVEVRIETNAPSRPELILHLSMIGARPLPFVTDSSGPINFGAVRDGQGPERLFVETREESPSRPWLEKVVTDMEGLAIAGRLAEERSLGRNTVFRRYKYTATLERLPSRAGAFSGEARFFSGGAPAAHVFSLPVYLTVKPPVYAAPSFLFRSFERNTNPAQLTVALSSDEPEFELVAVPDPDVPAQLAVEQTSHAGGRSTFTITTKGELKDTIKTTLVFRTNHPKAAIVRVPLVMQSISK